MCKTFLKSTLDVSDRMIFTIQRKQNENDFSQSDLRGRHQSHRKLSLELKGTIKQHIESIPKIESHYVRASTSREYIDGSKTIKDLFNDFKINREKKIKKLAHTFHITKYLQQNIIFRSFNLRKINAISVTLIAMQILIKRQILRKNMKNT